MPLRYILYGLIFLVVGFALGHWLYHIQVNRRVDNLKAEDKKQGDVKLETGITEEDENEDMDGGVLLDDD